MTLAQIKKVLKENGISKSIVSTGTIDGTKCVILQWNGRQEYVTASQAETLQMLGFENEAAQLSVWQDNELK